ncbi:hypothetical protein BD414DRAFT_498981 [Trametes punicea]|nr:hypothetical protein BD414DRAFT_498981 [Trametes punicea]
MMPDILEGPKDTWLRHYTSNRIGEKEVNQIISALKNERLVHDDKGTLRWRDFPDKPSVLYKQDRLKNKSTRKDGSGVVDTNNSGTARTHAQQPAGQGGNERKIFRPLGNIIDAIAKVPLPNLSPSCEYKEEPYSTDSEVSGSQHRIDGYLGLIKSTSPPAPKRSRAATSDVAVNFEFKSEDKPYLIRDNRWKMLYSAFHNLHSDCQRKHTYSMTIEDNHVCLWYFSRSHSAKSHDFDLLDVRAVIHALSALIFSTVEDLGYDTNIRRVVEQDEETKQDWIRYVYRLENRFFKTLKCRDEYDDLYIAGRATRVWEVVEVASFDDTAALPNAQPMILRDVWLDHGSDTEREIQEKIFARCDELGRNFPPKDDHRLFEVDDATRKLLHQRLKDGSYKQLFLTVKADYRGATSKNRAEGFTPAPDAFGELVYINQEAKTPGSDAQRASTSRTPGARDPDVSTPSMQQASAPRGYKPKQRNFVVYEEVCSALHELDDLHDVVQALLDAVLALQILFLISWIHRDVSSGNILYYKGRGILGDLEYAKEFNLAVGRRSQDPKTGTPIFMAVELHSGVAIYQESPFSVRIEDWNKRVTSAKSRLAIRHNFQHDLESIFWILAWLVFTHIPEQNCAHITANLFHSTSSQFVASRQNFLLNSDVCIQCLECLRPDLPPMLTTGLVTMRAILHKYYLDRRLSIGDLSSYSPIYGLFREVLETIAASVIRGTVRLVRPAQPTVDSRSGYRPCTEDLWQKKDSPEDVVLAPHKIPSMKRPRGASDADKVDDRAEKRSALG